MPFSLKPFALRNVLGALCFGAFVAQPLAVEAGPQAMAATSHLLWLRTDGSVWGAGDYDEGARGDQDASKPRRAFKGIPALREVIQVATRDNRSAALKEDGSLWVFGMYNGQEPYGVPKPLSGLKEMRQFALGSDFVVAIKADGSLWFQGDADHGLHNRREEALRGVRVAGLSKAVAVAATDWTAFFAQPDGSVWGWGSGFGNLLGKEGKWDFFNPTADANPRPLRIQGLDTVKVVALSGGSAHMLALTEDGRVFSWGNNEDGELGQKKILGIGDTAYQFPGEVSGLPPIQAISAGYDFSLALDREGRVWSWGNNTYGALGVSSKREEHRFTPKPVAGIEHAVSVHGGHYNGFAVLAGGQVMGWGSNGSDFIPGETREEIPPTRIPLPGGKP